MARVTGFTSERMLEIEGTTVIGGFINEGGRLILSRRDGFTIDAGEVKGSKGDPGSGVSDVEISYQASDSGTEEPTGEWSTNVPIVHVGQYLWVRTLTTYADPDDPENTFTTTTYTVTQQPGKGNDGRGILSQVVTYQEGTSGTTAPVGNWLSTPPEVAAGKYLWTRINTTYTDNTDNVAYSVAKQGGDGKPGEPGNNGLTPYLHVAYANSADGVEGFSTTDPAGRSYMGTCTTFTEPDPTDPSLYGWVLIKGSNGVGISSSNVRYQESTSGTVTPSGSWLDYVPEVAEGSYLWSRSITNFTDGASQTVYSVSKQGKTGSDGRGITSIVEEYYLSDSSSSPVGGTWSETRPEWSPGKYYWTRSTINYTSGNPTTTTPICVSGESGTSGRSVVDVDVYYYLSNSATSLIGGTWSTTAPTWVEGKYLWTKTVTTYSEGEPSESSPACITGSPGQPGKGIVKTTIEYAKNQSGTSAPESGWTTTVPSTEPGDYLWTRTTTEYTEGDDTVSYSVSKMGENGSTQYTWIRYADDQNGTGITDQPDGKKYIGVAYNKESPNESNNPMDYVWSMIQGVSVASITPFYWLGDTQPPMPTTMNPGEGWSETEPAYEDDSDDNLYVTIRTVMSNGGFTYTPVSLSAAFQASKNASTISKLARERADSAYAEAIDAALSAADADRKAVEASKAAEILLDVGDLTGEESFSLHWVRSDPDFGTVFKTDDPGYKLFEGFVAGADLSITPPAIVNEDGYIKSISYFELQPNETVSIELTGFNAISTPDTTIGIHKPTTGTPDYVAIEQIPEFVSNGSKEVLRYTNATEVKSSFQITITINTNTSGTFIIRNLLIKNITNLVNAQKAADAAKFLAEGIYQVIPSDVEPTEAPNGADLKQGDQWWVLGAMGSEFEGKFIGVQVYNGEEWQPRQIVADSVLVPGSVGSTLIEDGTITTNKLIVKSFDNLLENPGPTNNLNGWDTTGANVEFFDNSFKILEREYSGMTGRIYNNFVNTITQDEEYILSYEVKLSNLDVKLDTPFFGFRALNGASAGGTNLPIPKSLEFVHVEVTVKGSIQSSFNTTTLDVRPYMAFYVVQNGNAYFRNLRLRKKVDSSMIVEGSITADSLSAEALYGKVIQGGLIQGSTIEGSEIILPGIGNISYDVFDINENEGYTETTVEPLSPIAKYVTMFDFETGLFQILDEPNAQSTTGLRLEYDMYIPTLNNIHIGTKVSKRMKLRVTFHVPGVYKMWLYALSDAGLYHYQGFTANVLENRVDVPQTYEYEYEGYIGGYELNGIQHERLWIQLEDYPPVYSGDNLFTIHAFESDYKTYDNRSVEITRDNSESIPEIRFKDYNGEKTINIDNRGIFLKDIEENATGIITAANNYLHIGGMLNVDLYADHVRASKGVIDAGTFDLETAPEVSTKRLYNNLSRYAKIYPAAHGTLPEVGLQVGTDIEGHATFYMDGTGYSRITTHAGSATANGSRPIPFAMAAGSNSVSTSFPTFSLPGGNRFTQPPRMVGQLYSGAGGDIGNGAMITNITTTSFQARKMSGTGGTAMNWIAIQMTPTSANG